MSAVNDNYKNLISYLEKCTIACISDQEEVFSIDEQGNTHHEVPKPMAYLSFKYELNILKDLKQDFYDEITNNQFTLNFNKDSYYKEAITEFNELLKKFKTINVNNLQIIIRTDLCVKCLDYFENDSSENENEIGISSPVEIDLAKDQYEKIPIPLINKISAYFRLQEKCINSVLNHLNKFYQPNNKRNYNGDYPFKYFMFDSSKIGKRSSKKDCIKSFFSALIERGYVDGPECLNHLTLYFDNKSPSSNSKVVWKAKGRLLYDIVTELNSRKYIYDAEGSISNIIIDIFVKEDGSNFTQDELHSRHSSKKMTQEISKIIQLLGR